MSSPKLSSSLGTVGLVFGAGIALLAFMDANGGVPFQMPRSWYVNKSLWYLMGVASFVAGCLFLRGTSYQETEWEASNKRSRFERLVLYTRDGCHLCEQAYEILQRYSRYLPVIEVFDIDADEDLAQKFTQCVPVVEIDGKVRFRGRVNEILLRRLIEGTPLGAEAVAAHGTKDGLEMAESNGVQR